jgi:hypothetical protein
MQLVHEKLMLVRKNMGAHESYSFLHSRLELVEATDVGAGMRCCRSLQQLHTGQETTNGVLHTCEGVQRRTDGNVVQPQQSER